MMPNRERLAYHEAGHAVVQTLLGRGRFAVAEVSIHEGTSCVGNLGRVQGHALLDAEADLNLYELGLATLAGIAAENRYFEEHAATDEDKRWGAASDVDDWENACRRLYPDERRVRLMGLNVMRKLREMFADPGVWRVLRELAGVLAEKEAVAGTELQGLLAGLSELRFVGR
jgi:hypothetical protein